MKLNAIIVDDEELALKNLEIMLKTYCPEIHLIGSANNIDDAEKMIKEKQPDVVFLDIRMPSDAEGFELLERIKNRNFLVVFVTAFKEYAVQAFQANAVHYLLKPIDDEDLRVAVDKIIATREIFQKNPENYNNYFDALQNLANRLTDKKSTNKIAISHTKGVKVVEVDDITHVEANGNCSMIYFKDNTKYLDTRTLKVYEKILNTDQFYRIHKSHIINMDMIKEYSSDSGYVVSLKNGVQLPVARNRVSKFLKTIKGKE
ncbi:MAG: LytTR family DNA-binding domain-containing protein [Brumimicrobium sp.]